MAQTKRKRRSKHRGTAAGNIERRGRAGSKPLDGKKPSGGSKAQDARARREARMNREPSWRAAANRAAIATVIFLVAVVVVLRQPIAAAVSLSAFMLAVYIPLGYYTDLFLYRRRQKAKAGGGKAAPKGKSKR